MSTDTTALGVRYMVVAMVAFAIQDATSKYLAARYPPEFFIMIRYWLFAAFVVIVTARRAGGVARAARTRMPLLQILRGVWLALQILVVVNAFHLVGLGETLAIFSLYPLLAALLAIPVLGERISWRRGLAITAGFIGVLVILRPGTGVFRPEALLALLGAAMMAVYTVSTRLVGRADGSAIPAFFWLGIAGAAALTLIGPFYWTPMTLADWGWLALHSVVAMFGHYSLIRALELAEAVRIQPLTYLQVVFAVISGMVFFGERIDLFMVVGMALIIGSGLYTMWREMRRRSPHALAARVPVSPPPRPRERP